MSKTRTTDPSETVAGAVTGLAEYTAFRAAEARRDELRGELAQVEREIREHGERTGIVIEGRFVVEGYDRAGRREIRGRRTPLDTWRRNREQEARARALVDEGEVVVVADPATEALELVDRRETLSAAVELADQRVMEAHADLRRAAREPLREAYTESVVAPLPGVLETLGELADRHTGFLDALAGFGLPRDSSIEGLPLSSYSMRTPGSRLNILLDQARKLAGDAK